VETTTSPRSAGVAAPDRRPIAPEPLPSIPHVARPRWLGAFVVALVAVDAAAMGLATLLAKVSWVGLEVDDMVVRWIEVPYAALAVATVPTWLVILALAGAYDIGPFGSTAGMWTRVIRAGAQLLAVVAVSYYLLRLAMVGRGVLAAMIPLAVALTLGGRAMLTLAVARLRRKGRARRTALVVGSQAGVDAVVGQLRSRPQAGIVPVATEVLDGAVPEPDGPDGPDGVDGPNGTDGSVGSVAVGGAPRPDANGGNGAGDTGPAEAGGIPAPGEGTGDGGDRQQSARFVAALARSRAATLIVAGGLPHGQLRDVAWSLEGTGVELLVTPAPAEIGGLRSHIRPVAGLPLLYLDS
jgi:CoA-binding domain